MQSFYNSNEIKDFEIKILASGRCQCFVPMSFIRLKEKLKVTYYTEGYKNLDLVQLENPYELIGILEKLVLCIKEAQNHLILFTRYSLGNDYIFINQDLTSVKIKFVPICEECGNRVFSNKMVSFLKKLQMKDIRCREYIDMIIEKLLNFNLSMESLINYLGELKREAYLCGWG